jgi:hypothetical protein
MSPRHTAQQHGAAVTDREQQNESSRWKSVLIVLGAVLLVTVCYALLNAS